MAPEATTRPWKCCDLKVCTRSYPPSCICLDKVEQCDAACARCVEAPESDSATSSRVCKDWYHGDPGPRCTATKDGGGGDEEGAAADAVEERKKEDEEDAAAAKERKKEDEEDAAAAKERKKEDEEDAAAAAKEREKEDDEEPRPWSCWSAPAPATAASRPTWTRPVTSATTSTMATPGRRAPPMTTTTTSPAPAARQSRSLLLRSYCLRS